MQLIDQLTFTSPINIDNGFQNIPQGEHESTMKLLSFHQGDCIEPLIQIEWDNPIDTVHMNIEYHEDGEGLNRKKIVTGYDGVFELPEQAIQLLESNGFNCEQVK